MYKLSTHSVHQNDWNKPLHATNNLCNAAKNDAHHKPLKHCICSPRLKEKIQHGTLAKAKLTQANIYKRIYAWLI